MTREQLAKKIYDECLKDGEPVTEEESLEMADMEIKAGNVKLSVGRETKGKSSAPKRKEDIDKRYLIKTLADVFPIENSIVNVERQIDFEYNGECYSITLTKHRKPKA